MPHRSASRAAFALLLTVLWLVLGALAAPSAALGQAVVPSQPGAAATAEADPERVRALIATLEDEKTRNELIAQLELLLAADAPAEAEQPEAETLGSRMLVLLSNRLGAIGAQFAAFGEALARFPELGGWLRDQVADGGNRDRWAEILSRAAVVIGAGIAGYGLVRWLLRGPRRRFEARSGDARLVRWPLVLLHAVLSLLPLVAFGFAAYAAVGVVDPRATVRLVVLAAINAVLVTGAVLTLARAVLMPRHPGLRPVPLAGETAAYLTVWVRRITYTAVFGTFVASAAVFLGLPSGARSALLTLVGLAVGGMLIVFVLQNRPAVAQWLRGPPPRQAAGDAIPAPGGARRALGVLRRRLAEVWHILAIAYVAAIFAIWALAIEGGFAFVLRATGLTLLILVLARGVTALGNWLIDRAFSVGRELQARYPRLEARANLYLPLLRQILGVAVTVVSVLALLEVWGLGGIAWIETDFGRRFLAGIVSIGFVLLAALVAWEVVSSVIERHLGRKDANGDLRLRSARARTLLPLLRNAFLVVLVTVVSLIVLGELGLDITPLLAGAGVVGLAVGFGAQTLVKDVITGLFILFEDTIAVGDVVEVAGHSGTVEGMTIRTVWLRDEAGAVHTIPFSAVTAVVNMTKDYAFAVLRITIAPGEDPERVTEILGEVAAELEADPVFKTRILAPVEIMGIDGLGAAGTVIKARLETRPMQQWAVTREFNRRLKRRLDEAKVVLG